VKIVSLLCLRIICGIIIIPAESNKKGAKDEAVQVQAVRVRVDGHEGYRSEGVPEVQELQMERGAEEVAG